MTDDTTQLGAQSLPLNKLRGDLAWERFMSEGGPDDKWTQAGKKARGVSRRYFMMGYEQALVDADVPEED